jgi:hypothetical protein
MCTRDGQFTPNPASESGIPRHCKEGAEYIAVCLPAI